MVKVKKLGVVLEPSFNYFDSSAVLNPGVWQEGEYVHMFYRAIDSELRSSIGYAKFKGPTKLIERWEKPIIRREYGYESKGVEDPRLIKLGNLFYLFYVAHDGKNAITAYATGRDLKSFKKKGIISPQIIYHDAAKIFRESKLKDAYFFFSSFYEEYAGKDVFIWHKDVLLFPQKINGRFALLHRVMPDIQIIFFDRFKDLTTAYWENYLKDLSQYVVLENKHWFETRHIGGGCPPIETKDGWLLIFHAVEETNQGRIYRASAALLDKNNPLKVIGRLHEPLFSPTEEWEKSGLVSNVVFPTGAALFGDDLHIYYGAADKRICAASVNINELLKELKDPTKSHEYGKQ